MKVILTERIEKLGKVGDIVEVKDGYARNFLLPKDKALLDNKSNRKVIENRKKILEAKALKEEQEAKELAASIEGIVVTIKKKAGEEGKLFGSVQSSDIVSALKTQNVEIERKAVLLSESIKALGEFEVKLRIYPGIEPIIKVVVEKEE